MRVLDLSSLLPGPLATLFLAQCGAEVIRIERPGRGDEMRSYVPKFGEASANYAILNRGKSAFAADLKNTADREAVLALAADADVVVEQFRPRVADRIGVGYQDIVARNPRVIYCSISGYGQSGPHAQKAGHDLNYLAESGLLGVVTDRDGMPPLPIAPLADIVGGAYPALANILLALLKRERTGEGARLDISMTHSLQVLMYGYFASKQAGGDWPEPGAELLTGGSPRYRMYKTSDGRFVAVAALEERFWSRLLDLLDLPGDLGEGDQPAATLAKVFRSRPSEYWQKKFANEDVCVSIVATMAEAEARGLVQTNSQQRLVSGSLNVGALPLPLAEALCPVDPESSYPSLPAIRSDSRWRSTP